MENQKQKLEVYRQNIGQQYAYSKHIIVDQQAQIMSEGKRISPKHQSPKFQSGKVKAIENYRMDNKKAQQMLSFPLTHRQDHGFDNQQSPDRDSPAIVRNVFSLENDQDHQQSVEQTHSEGSDAFDENNIEMPK